jgi:hypothetical protein
MTPHAAVLPGQSAHLNFVGTQAFLPSEQVLRPRVTPFRHAALLASVTAVCLLGPVHARAQLIDQYLNPNIPGYGTNPGVTVASRQRPEYDPEGIRYDGFTFTPVLSETAGYDDNVTGTASPRGSALIETNPSLGIATGWSDTQFDASLSADNVEYLQQSNQSYTNWTAAIGASHDFGRDTLSVGYTHLNLYQTPQQLDSPLLSSAIAYRVDDARGSYKVDLGRAYLLPTIEVSAYSYDNGTVEGQPYLQAYRDRFVYAPSLEAGYEFASRRRVVIILRDAQANYNAAPPNAPRENFNDASILAGLAYDFDGDIAARLLAGYEQRNFPAHVYKTISAPIVEGSVTWTPTELTTLTGTAARYIEDAAAEGTTGYTETAIKLNLDHEYLRNVILSAHAALYLDDYAAGFDSNGGSQSYFTGGIGASWLLSRTLRLAADYTYSARRSKDGVEFPTLAAPVDTFFGGNYSANTFRLTLRFAL